jgi:hypothetical protein
MPARVPIRTMPGVAEAVRKATVVGEIGEAAPIIRLTDTIVFWGSSAWCAIAA